MKNHSMKGARVVATVDMIVAVFWITAGFVSISAANGYIGFFLVKDSINDIDFADPMSNMSNPYPAVPLTTDSYSWASVLILNTVAAIFIMIEICFLMFANVLLQAIDKRCYDKLSCWISVASMFYVVEFVSTFLVGYMVVYKYGTFCIGFFVYPIAKLIYEAVAIIVVKYHRDALYNDSISRAPSTSTVVEHL